MRRFHWLSIVILGVSISGAALFAADEASVAPPATGQAEAMEPVLSAFQSSIDRIAAVLESQSINPAARRALEIAEQDLQAQRDMAKWAERMFWAAFASVVLTAIGVVLIRQTLVYTKKTLEEAEATSKAAVRAIESTRRLERPYLFANVTTREVDFYSLFETQRKTGRTDLYPRIRYDIMNRGKTPAIIKEYSTGADSRDNSDHPVYSVQRHDEPFVLEPGMVKDQFFVAEHDQISAENVEDFRTGKKPINFYARITYEDVFGDEHVTSFYWRYRAREGFSPYRDPAADKNYRT